MTGNLSVQQLTEISEVFSLFDRSSTQSITISQMVDVYRALGQTPSEADMEMLKKEADPDGAGRIELSDFIQVYCRYQAAPLSELDLLAAFEELDEKRTGTIQMSKLQELLTTCLEPLTEKSIKRLLRHAAPDASGNIQYKSFVKVLQAKWTDKYK